MTKVQEFKTFLKALINSSRRKAGNAGGATIKDIKKDLAFYENIEVDKFVHENGHRNLLDLINEWEEFTVHYGTNEPIVKLAYGGDHISEMNKHSKLKRGTINSIAKQINSPRRLRVIGPDPFGFSPESSINVFLHDDIGQNLPELPTKETFSSISLDEILNIMDSNVKKVANESNETAKNDVIIQQPVTNEMRKRPTKGIDQIITQMKTSQPPQMIPTTSKAVSKDSVPGSQVRQTPRQKMSIYKNFNSHSSSLQFKLVKTIDKLIPSCKTLDPSVKNVISVAMLDVVNPHRFWFAEYSEYKALNELMKNMQEFYQKNQDSLRISVQDLQRGLYVGALYEGIWHRGMIVKIDENFSRICYVDFGTAYDISHIDLCYLKEDFLNLPSIARRGVLAFVQPLENDKWSDESGIFFENNIKQKKIEVKLYKHISRDNSYYVSIKHKNEQKSMELLANTMIRNNLAKADLMFLDNEIVSKDSFEFHEYEEGILLDKKPQTPNVIEAFDSWMPFDFSKTPSQMTKKINTSTSIPSFISSANNSSKKRSASKAFMTPVKNVPALNTSIPKVCEEIKRNLTNEFNNVAEHPGNQVETSDKVDNIIEEIVDQQQSSQSIFQPEQNRPDSNLSNSTIIPMHGINDINIKESGLIKKQSFEKLIVGDVIDIYIHVIYDASCFFFYIKNDMVEIKKFLDDLNASYKGSYANLSDEDLMINKEVVVFNDNNYCRALIKSKNKNFYQVFLIDFGVFLVKKCDEMYRLQKEYVKKQNCIYKGTIQNCSKEEYIKLKSAYTGKFCVAKILGIRNENTVDLKLEAFN